MKDIESYKKNDRVKWNWLGGIIYGIIIEVYTSSVSKVIKGKTIKRNGSVERPAYFVQSEAGNFALKLHSEISSATELNSKNKLPTKFN